MTEATEGAKALVVNDKRHVPADLGKAGGGTLMETLASAVRRGLPVETLNALMDFQERYEKFQARKAFDAAMAAARAEIPVIIKNREVDFSTQKGRTNYVYEDLGAIAKAVDPIIARHGLSYRFRTTQDGATVTVACIVSHHDGYSEENSLSAGRDESGNKNSIQGVGSTITYLQRYSLKAALGLAASKDEDGRSAEEEAFDPSSWTDRIMEAGKDDLARIADELKSVKDIPPGAMKIIRNAWAQRRKHVEAQ